MVVKGSNSGIGPTCVQILALPPNSSGLDTLLSLRILVCKMYPNNILIMQNLNGIIIVLRVDVRIRWDNTGICEALNPALEVKSSLAIIIITSSYVFDRATAYSYTGCALYQGIYLRSRFMYLLLQFSTDGSKCLVEGALLPNSYRGIQCVSRLAGGRVQISFFWSLHQFEIVVPNLVLTM